MGTIINRLEYIKNWARERERITKLINSLDKDYGVLDNDSREYYTTSIDDVADILSIPKPDERN